MRAYSESSQESIRARDLLKDWAGEGLLTEAQYHQLEPETVCDLRRTNVFLRIVLFLFTLIIVVPGVGLFSLVALLPTESKPGGMLLLIFAAIYYAAAEFAVSEKRLYRFGIEEALAACSVGFLCAGLQTPLVPQRTEFLVPAACAIVSIWIWHRFGFAYASFPAMIFLAWLASYGASSLPGQHLSIAAVYAAALVIVAAVHPRYRFTYLNNNYSIAEALLWIGIYLAINLQLLPDQVVEYSKPFYWTTWVLIWCLPPIVIIRGVRFKDRFVIAAGVIAAILTLVTNKPYLGWPRHTWDPMLLGAFLIGVALFIRRWLAAGPGEIRHGFTARRLSGKDKRWMNAGVSALGLVSPNVIPPSSPEVRFGGGESGGGGASSDF